MRFVSCLYSNIVCKTNKIVDLTFMTAVDNIFASAKEKFISWDWLKLLSLMHIHSGNCKAYCNEFDMKSHHIQSNFDIIATKSTLFYQPTNNNHVAATQKPDTKHCCRQMDQMETEERNENETAILDVFNFQSKLWFDQTFQTFWLIHCVFVLPFTLADPKCGYAFHLKIIINI